MRLGPRSSAPCRPRFLAGLLILTLVELPGALLAEGGRPAYRGAAASEKPLTQQERAIHALNRLTFGPEPGGVERVEAMGVEKWIELQLNPQRIDDSQLQAQLENYPAMKMPLRKLVEEFPSNQVIRAVANGKWPLPVDRVERAIYEDQVADFELRKQKQAELAAPNQAAAGALTLGEAAASPAIEVHEQKLYADLAATAILNLPPDQRWNKLLEMKAPEFRAFLRDLTNKERLQLTPGMTPQQKETVVALVNPTLLVSEELLETRLLTDIYSQRQLQAVMTDFWLNHFNVYLRKGPFAAWYLADFERNAIAPHALGKFEDLLVATAKSPAMLFYLDNHTSVGPHSMAAFRASMNPNNRDKTLGINENYGRELMELHTLGVNGGYTQQDVIEVAKAFTGWTIESPRQGSGFVFNERRHEPGPKYVMGRRIQENGEEEGLEVLHMLASSPATAHHLSEELAERFVSDTPPPALVDRMAKTYLKSGGDIRQVLSAMFNSPEFWSRDAYRAKVKTPEKFVISAVRATGGQVVRPALLLNAISELGMPFYGCQTPNGYPWTAQRWVNTGDLLDRMNISLALTGQRLGAEPDMDALLKIDQPDAVPASEKEARLEEILLQRQLPPQTSAAVLQQLEQSVPRPSGQAGKQAGRPSPVSAQGATPSRAVPRGLPGRAILLQWMDDSPQPILRPADRQAALLAGLLLGSPEFQKK